MSTHSILCGSCKSPAETVANPKSHDKVTCSRCGREDRFDNVMRAVSNYVADSAAKRLSSSLAKIASRSKVFKVTKQHRPQRSHRWIAANLGL